MDLSNMPFLVEAMEIGDYKPEDIIEFLESCPGVATIDVDHHRWWDTEIRIVRVGDHLVGFGWAHANRDESIFDLGWTFDPATICEYVAKEVVATTYVPVIRAVTNEQ